MESNRCKTSSPQPASGRAEVSSPRPAMCIPKTQQHTSGAAAQSANWDAASHPSDHEEPRQKPSNGMERAGTTAGPMLCRQGNIWGASSKCSRERNPSLSHGRAWGLGKREPGAAVCLSVCLSIPAKLLPSREGVTCPAFLAKG